jgi:hypothetical protein
LRSCVAAPRIYDHFLASSIRAKLLSSLAEQAAAVHGSAPRVAAGKSADFSFHVPAPTEASLLLPPNRGTALEAERTARPADPIV